MAGRKNEGSEISARPTSLLMVCRPLRLFCGNEFLSKNEIFLEPLQPATFSETEDRRRVLLSFIADIGFFFALSFVLKSAISSKAPQPAAFSGNVGSKWRPEMTSQKNDESETENSTPSFAYSLLRTSRFYWISVCSQK